MNQNLSKTPLQPKKTREALKKELEPLTERELELIYWLRTRFRFGEVTIVVRDGEPFRIAKAYETHDL